MAIKVWRDIRRRVTDDIYLIYHPCLYMWDGRRPYLWSKKYSVYVAGRWVGNISQEGSSTLILDFGGFSWEQDRYGGAYGSRRFDRLGDLTSYLTDNADAIRNNSLSLMNEEKAK